MFAFWELMENTCHDCNFELKWDWAYVEIAPSFTRTPHPRGEREVGILDGSSFGSSPADEERYFATTLSFFFFILYNQHSGTQPEWLAVNIAHYCVWCAISNRNDAEFILQTHISFPEHHENTSAALLTCHLPLFRPMALTWAACVPANTCIQCVQLGG